MWLKVAILGLILSGQIPPPEFGASSAQDLKAKRRQIFESENGQLKMLADRLDREKKGEASAAVRKLIITPTDSDALTRFVPLPEVVPSKKQQKSDPWNADLDKIRSQAATELLDLAKKAATADSPQWGLASLCVRDALQHAPDQPEARRLLGFEPYEGGWARPFAIQNLRSGKVLHPIYGWVFASWVSELEAGKLPAPNKTKDLSKPRWVPAEEADRLRADGNPPWIINTEHFQIQSNVRLSETISFGRKLENFYELFFTVMADVVGKKLTLAQRLLEPAARNSASPVPYKPHLIYFFASKDQYLAHLRNIAPPDIADSLGYYHPLGPAGSKTRRPAYFFLDEGGQIDVTATLFHEVSHQLLFERVGGASTYERNEGNYWVFEGLGTFFETVLTHPDGSMEVGGFVGPRVDVAVRNFTGSEPPIPTGLFVGFRKDIFNLRHQVYTNYQQAQALTLFLMRWHDGSYRDAFLDYIGDALKGTLKPNSGRSLQDRLGVPYDTIDAQFLEFLKEMNASRPEPRRQEVPTGAGPTASGDR